MSQEKGRWKNGSPTQLWIDQMLAAKPEGCWIWPFAARVRGYPVVARGEGGSRKNIYVSHIMLEKTGSPRPDEWAFALHSCDVPLCVNPEHLRWGTPAENAQDMVDRGRWQGSRVLSREVHNFA